ncbi:unnamed protein product [Heligmosomoides polygyrus]|uniref:Saposin B-type domain-containing protein n=1 Tax=Heligmosomoides polygyrus TaxID=6339 RepID=A0A183FKM2_HELPZ|nr:unnamed protein product [Heligmosomoides polygyrus]
MNTVLIVLALLLYAAVDLALANCYVCKTVAQGAEFDLEDDKDMRNVIRPLIISTFSVNNGDLLQFVTDQCSYHEVLYYTYEMISLCQQIAPRIVSSPDILQMLRVGFSNAIEN